MSFFFKLTKQKVFHGRKRKLISLIESKITKIPQITNKKKKKKQVIISYR